MKRHGLQVNLHNRRVAGFLLDNGDIAFEFVILRNRASREIDTTRIRLSDEATRATVRIALELLGFVGAFDVDQQPSKKETP